MNPGAPRVGFDLVAVPAVAEALRLHGDTYLRRVYAAAEIEACRRGDELDHGSLAARLAGKEAFMKMLPVADEPIVLTAIEITRASRLRLTGSAAEAARARGIVRTEVALGHTRGMASAIVLGWAGA